MSRRLKVRVLTNRATKRTLSLLKNCLAQGNYLFWKVNLALGLVSQAERNKKVHEKVSSLKLPNFSYVILSLSISQNFSVQYQYEEAPS